MLSSIESLLSSRTSCRAPKHVVKAMKISSQKGMHLRSSSISPSFSRALALLSDVSSRGVGSCPPAAAAGVIASLALTLDIFHSLVLIIGSIVCVAHTRQLLPHIDLFSLKKAVDDLTNLPVSWAEPTRITVPALRL